MNICPCPNLNIASAISSSRITIKCIFATMLAQIYHHLPSLWNINTYMCSVKTNVVVLWKWSIWSGELLRFLRVNALLVHINRPSPQFYQYTAIWVQSNSIIHKRSFDPYLDIIICYIIHGDSCELIAVWYSLYWAFQRCLLHFQAVYEYFHRFLYQHETPHNVSLYYHGCLVCVQRSLQINVANYKRMVPII